MYYCSIEELQSFLKKWLIGARLFIILGIGNELRSDDAAGLLVARALKPFNSEKFEAIECGASIDSCIDYAFEKNPSHLLIVDAFPNGERLAILDPTDLDSYVPASTHDIPIPLLLEAFGKPLETDIKILGIGVEKFDLGEKVSGECLKAVNGVVKAILEAVINSGVLKDVAIEQDYLLPYEPYSESVDRAGDAGVVGPYKHA
ncbi:MAG: hydrogenase maturation protease [Thermoproteota archaeon]|nr:hydrogenase maturation protease [Candidatus Brockarchaeota archaeon]MBO3840439.1 hydrogenase maturation protease [Candidatus Brockarchaeota archaeon]